MPVDGILIDLEREARARAERFAERKARCTGICESCDAPFLPPPSRRCLVCDARICMCCCDGVDLRAVGFDRDTRRCTRWKALHYGRRDAREELVVCHSDTCEDLVDRFNVVNKGRFEVRLDLDRPL